MHLKNQPVGTIATSLLLCGLLALLYVAMIFTLPANKLAMQALSMTESSYHILLFTAVLPGILTWFPAFFAYASLRSYASSLEESPEREDFKRLASGVAWLAWSLPISAMSTLLLNAIANQHPDFRPSSIIISNYIALILPLVGFAIISTAAKGLISHTKVRFNSVDAKGIILFFVTAGVAYCYLTFSRFDSGSLTSTDNPYFLPIWLMVLTVIIPYLYAWFVGLLAVYELNAFSKNVKGLLYRQALRWLAIGLTLIIISSISVQYLNSAQPRVGYLLLNYKILITTLLKLVGGTGFVLIIVGVTRLKRIEEV